MKNLNLPVQVETLISNLLDKNQSILIRNNYRNSLDIIRAEAEKAVAQYDKEWAKDLVKDKRK